ncbi:MAG: class beta-lactamase [Caulobacter sp.]|nr:class beta-lactamase [Caulobacter sp.]
MFNRRRVLASALLVPTFGAVGGHALAAARPEDALFAELEARSGGRLGVAATDTKTGKRLWHRVNERFPMCSTFKFLAVAVVLSFVGHKTGALKAFVPYGRADLVANSPITELHVAEGGMTLEGLCEAAITHSDNTAGNLLLNHIAGYAHHKMDGPSAFTAFAGMLLHAKVTRLDRTETALNEAAPGDPRDTTTPAAMLDAMARLLLHDTLTPANRERLTGWLIDNQTGGNRIRAGMPEGWIVGDKTGAGENGTTNDIAIIWPEGRDKPPILLAIYLTGSSLSAPGRDQIIAQTARAAVHLLRGVPNHG